MAFGRKKSSRNNTEEEKVTPPALPKGYTPGKGAPTPKRRDVESRKRKPIIPDKVSMTKAERKALRAEERARNSAQWEREQKALKEGDIKNMPIGHRGEERAFARDALDARFQFASYMALMALVLIVGMFVVGQYGTPAQFNAFVLSVYAIIILMFVEAWFKARKIRRLVAYRFGDAKVPPRLAGQMTSRAFTPRRFRLPRPRVKRGEYPKGGDPEDMKAAMQSK